MEERLFWLFMLAMDLLIPVCMLGLGWRFQADPPKEINSSYGYRTVRSMQSQEAWEFAHAYSGKFWAYAGWLALAGSILWMALLFGKEIGTVGLSACFLTGIQMIPFLAVIPATGRALKREFDDYGRKRE